MKKKRIFTIICLAGAMAVSFPAMMQSQSSSTKATTQKRGAQPFGAATLIQKGTYSNGFESNMEGTLRRMGFAEKANVFSKDGISIDFNDPLNLKVTFPTIEARDKFIEETKDFGYEWDGTKCTNGVDLSLDIAVDGNTVSIFFAD